MNNTYTGERTRAGVLVLVNGTALNPRHEECRHSPTGFEFGYGGSGPAQLAYAILRHEFNQAVASAFYQTFKAEVINCWAGDCFVTSSRYLKDWLSAADERIKRTR